MTQTPRCPSHVIKEPWSTIKPQSRCHGGRYDFQTSASAKGRSRSWTGHLTEIRPPLVSRFCVFQHSHRKISKVAKDPQRSSVHQSGTPVRTLFVPGAWSCLTKSATQIDSSGLQSDAVSESANLGHGSKFVRPNSLVGSPRTKQSNLQLLENNLFR